MSDCSTHAFDVPLKPCPFCGGEAEMLHAVGEWWAICKFCKATTEAHTDKGFAIAAWNARADYHGFEQAAIEAWESVKAWNSRAERTCRNKSKSGTSFWCSKCDAATSDAFADVGGKLTRFNYCPNCGCKLVGE